MAYTPQLSQIESGILRRLAWAIRQPMTTTLSHLFDSVAKYADPAQVCPHCKDRSFCPDCPFFRNLKRRVPPQPEADESTSS
jgi:hypothetical protein